MRQSEFSKFFGAIWALVADLTTVMVITYFVTAFWLGRAPDYHLAVAGRAIPPEIYAFLLLPVFFIVHFIKAMTLPKEGGWGKFFFAEDTFVSIGTFVFFALTGWWALMLHSQPTFLAVLGGFFATSIVLMFVALLYRHGKARMVFPQSRIGSGGYDASTEQIPGITADMPLRIRPRVTVIGPDGQEYGLPDEHPIAGHVTSAIMGPPNGNQQP